MKNFKVYIMKDTSRLIKFNSQLDFIESSILNKKLQSIICKGKCKRLIFDFSEIRYFNAVLIGMLISYSKKIKIIVIDKNNHLFNMLKRININLDKLNIEIKNEKIKGINGSILDM